MRRVICVVLVCVFALPGVAAAVEPTNGQIAAVSGRDQLVRFNPDGTALRTLWRVPDTRNDYIDEPAWSRDGNQIAFVYWDLAHASRIAVVDLRTGLQRTITDHPGPVQVGVFTVHTQDRHPGWTADGRVVFVRSTYDTERQRHDLMTVKPDGTDLAPLPVDPVDADPVSWAPDGWVLHRDGSNYLWRSALDGTGAEILPFTGLELPVGWSPDGQRIAYGAGGIGAISLDGDDVDVTRPATGRDVEPNWSPDGKAILFKRFIARQAGGELEQLRIVDLATGTERRVLDGNYFSPVWQPCVAGVTVRCAAQPIGCSGPVLDPPSQWDLVLPCLPPLEDRQVPVQQLPSGPVVPKAPAVSAKFDRKTKRVTLQVQCANTCAVSARVRLLLNTGRVLKGKVAVRNGRVIQLKLALPRVPAKRRIVSLSVIGTTQADGVKRALALTVKR